MLDDFLFKKHLEDDETVSQIVHQYWTVGLQYLFWPSIAFLAGWLFLAVAPSRLVLIFVSCWTLFTLIWWARSFLDYYLDAWVITDHGIIALEWMGWFHRQSTRILYSDIQGVSYEIKGIVATLSRMGTLSIEKISTGASVSIENVRDPKRIEVLVLRNMEAYLHAKNLKNATHVQELLSEFVAEKYQLQKSVKKDSKPRSSMTSRRV